VALIRLVALAVLYAPNASLSASQAIVSHETWTNIAAPAEISSPTIGTTPSGEESAPVAPRELEGANLSTPTQVPKPMPRQEGIPDAFRAAPKGAFSIEGDKRNSPVE